MTDNIDALIDRVLLLDAEATAGPWTIQPNDVHPTGREPDRGFRILEVDAIQRRIAQNSSARPMYLAVVIDPFRDRAAQARADAESIAIYRSAAPQLARECQRLRERVAELEDDLWRARQGHD